MSIVHRGHTQANLPAGVQQLFTERARLGEHVQDIQRFDPDVVLDMNPYVQGDAELVMEVFHGLARRIVAISSGDVTRAYGRVIGTEPGPVEPTPLTEEALLRERLYPYRGESPRSKDDPERWMDDYDKILVERVVMSNPDLPGTIVRLPMVYGPRDRQRRLFAYLKRMDDHRPFILLGEHVAQWRWSRGYVGNIAAAIALTVTDDRASGRIYHVCDEPTLTEEEWVKAIGKVAGWNARVITMPEEQLPERLTLKINAAQDLVFSSARIRQELGYREPFSLDDALAQTIAWQRANAPETVDADLFDYALEDAAVARLRRPS